MRPSEHLRPCISYLGLRERALRARLAEAFGSDRPAAFVEDAVALGGALLIGVAMR